MSEQLGNILYLGRMEHRAHLLGALVFLPLLLCPLMHYGHGDHSDHDSSKGTSR
jgi:hypothetical protein